MAAHRWANLARRDISQLTALIKTRLRRMQYRPGLLDGFLAKTGLDFALWGLSLARFPRATRPI